jgi:hypothetical protein
LRRLLSAAVASLLLAACGLEVAPQYRVDDLRILAVRAEVVGSETAFPAADADVGDRLRVAALVANPRGRAPIHVTWLTCLPTATEALPPCLDPSLLRAPDRLLAHEGVVVLAEGDGLEAFEMDVPDVSAVLDALIARATAEPEWQCRLYEELPVVAIVAAEDRREIAVKRVRLTPTEAARASGVGDRYVVNLNPAVDSIRLEPLDEDTCEGGDPLAVRCDGGAPDVCAGLECDAGGTCGVTAPRANRLLCGRPASGSAQVFRQCGATGTLEFYESLEWQWYVTDGTFDDVTGVGNATGRSIRFARPAGPFTLWAIVRDGRGGEAWIRRDVI